MSSRASFKSIVVLLTVSGIFFLILSFVSFKMLSHSFGHKSSTKAGALFANPGSVGVIELNGVILESKSMVKKIDAFMEDRSIAAIVMRINSPGGAVAPSQEIYEKVRQVAKVKPIITSMGSVAASGGYYIAAGTQKIMANAGTLTGSIGVIMEFANLERLYDWAKIQRYVIKTGKFKDTGSEYRAMSPEEREFLQNLVQNTLGQFKAAVAQGRAMTKEKVDAIADGRIFTGEQAKNVGLVDELGTLEDAIHLAATMAKLEGKPKVVYPEKKRNNILETVMDQVGGGDDDSDEDSRTNLAGRTHGWLEGLMREVMGVSAAQTLPSGIYWLWKI